VKDARENQQRLHLGRSLRMREIKNYGALYGEGTIKDI